MTPDEIKIDVFYHTWWGGVLIKQVERSNIPALGDEVKFEDGKVYRVGARTFFTELNTNKPMCDIYLSKWTIPPDLILGEI